MTPLPSWFLQPLPPAGEQEIKFLIPPEHSHSFSQWLDAQFLLHPNHGVSTVCSIYFDTDDQASFREKEASDYLKTKYRVRWYTCPAGRPLAGPAYLEVKAKEGVSRTKSRVRLPHTPAQLEGWTLEDPEFETLIRQHLPEARGLPSGGLKPVLEIRYLRRRYLHPVFRETFCLDSDIRCQRAVPGWLPAAHGRALPFSVFEQKGAAIHPLPVLRALPRFGARRAAVSKYFLTIRHLLPLHEQA